MVTELKKMRKITIALMKLVEKFCLKKVFLYRHFFIGILLQVAIIMVGELKLNGSITSPQGAIAENKNNGIYQCIYLTFDL